MSNLVEVDNFLDEVDHVFAELDNLVAEVDNLLAEVDNLLAEVDNLLAEVDNFLAEADNIVGVDNPVEECFLVFGLENRTVVPEELCILVVWPPCAISIPIRL